MDMGSDTRCTWGRMAKSFGYESMGESVPEVMMTGWKRSSTGRMAREASRQASCRRRGSETPAVRLPAGSKSAAWEEEKKGMCSYGE